MFPREAKNDLIKKLESVSAEQRQMAVEHFTAKVETAQQKLDEAKRFRPDYAPGETKSERQAAALLATEQEVLDFVVVTVKEINGLN